jgi:CheY-like chemotaxis protein
MTEAPVTGIHQALPVGEHVLVIDDDTGIREALRDVLQAEGYAVDVAADGSQALELLQTHESSGDYLPRVILLDLNMPGMNGWEFRAAQRLDPRLLAIPVVILTADGQARLKATSLGVPVGLTKPIGLDDLLSTVDAYC